MRTSELVSVFTPAITATTTSAAIPFADVKMATIVFTEAGAVNNRSGALTVTASLDGTNYYPVNILIDNAAGANNMTTTIASKTVAAAGTSLLFIPELSPFKFIKVVVTVSDGASPAGNFTVGIYKKYED